MSRRFGRNQKRALQEAVECAKAETHAARELLAWSRQQGAQRDYALKLTAEVLGKHFIGLPAQETAVQVLQRSYNMARMSAPMSFHASRDEDVMNLVHSIKRLEGNALEVKRFQDMIHIRYRTPRGEASYAISDEAWESLPFYARADYLARDIANDLSRMLAAEMGGKA